MEFQKDCVHNPKDTLLQSVYVKISCDSALFDSTFCILSCPYDFDSAIENIQRIPVLFATIGT